MAAERESVLLWLPATFVIEVLAWEIGSRLGVEVADPTFEEFGRSIDVEFITWGLAGLVVVLLVVFTLLFKGRHKGEVSSVQLVGVLALVAYWIGASVVASAAVVMLATVATAVLSRRPIG